MTGSNSFYAMFATIIGLKTVPVNPYSGVGGARIAYSSTCHQPLGGSTQGGQMTEIRARYTVGNIVHVDFGWASAWMRPEPMNLVPAEYDSLQQASESAYLSGVNTSEQSNPKHPTPLGSAVGEHAYL